MTKQAAHEFVVWHQDLGASKPDKLLVQILPLGLHSMFLHIYTSPHKHKVVLEQVISEQIYNWLSYPGKFVKFISNPGGGC